MIFASGAWAVAWLPSLLPNGTLLQGVVAGLLAAIGYGTGATLGAIIRLLRGEKARERPAPRWYVWLAWICAGAGLVVGALLAPGLAEQARAMNSPALVAQWLMAAAIGLVTAVVLVFVARGFRLLARRLGGGPEARTSLRVLGVIGTVVIVVVVAGLGYLAMKFAFNRIDASTSGQTAPTSSSRSGGPGSLIAFDSLGREGRKFVSQGQPESAIRAFAGLGSADSPQQRAQLAVADMVRAGGADATVWIGITTTGNGQIDPVAAQVAETTTGGRAAEVAIQYSTLPSWLSFLVNQSQAQEAGVALYDALVAARDALPAGKRPKLILYGESLGAFGSPAPFAGMTPAEVAQRIDGALWVGPPAATDPVTGWTYSGAPPVWQPTVDGGRTLRYAATAEAAGAPPGDGPWPTPRILVLQNPTDPVVWFAPKLAIARPDWLDDPRGPGMQPRTTWTPVLFFLQVAMDLPQAVNMPSGYGHNYADALPAAWAQVLGD